MRTWGPIVILALLALFVLATTIALVHLFVVPLPPGWRWIGPTT